MSDKKIKSIIIVMSVVSLLMIYNYYNGISIVKKYENKLIKIQRNFYENPQKNILINPVDYRYKKVRLATKYMKEEFSEINLVCVFDGNKGCYPCINSEIALINDIFLEYPKNIKVFFIGDNSHRMQQYNPLFDFTIINGYESLFKDYTLYENNTNFIVNRFGEIMDIHRPETGVELKSKHFYKRLKYLLGISNK